MTKEQFFELARQHDYSDSPYFWGESGGGISFAFDICLALWAYWLGHNESDSLIQAILQKMEFHPGVGLTEWDIVEGETEEYTNSAEIYANCTAGELSVYINALEYIHENLEVVE